MKIEKLPSGSYRIQKTIDGKRRSITFDHKPTQKEISQAIYDYQNHSVTLHNAPKKTFYECADEYMSIKSNVLSVSTLRTYKAINKNLPDYLSQCLLGNIDSLLVQRYINDITPKKSPKTVKNHYSFINAVVVMFIKERSFDVKLPQAKKANTYVPTTEEVKSVLEQAEIEKYRIVFLLGANGLRMSEILALTLDDFGDDYVSINKAMLRNADNEWVIQNRTKTTNSTRIVPLDKSIVSAIRKQGFVFEGHPRKIEEYLDSCQKRAGVPKFKFHALRHYYATELNQAGVASKDIQYVGGWSSDYIMTAIYQHARADENKQIQSNISNTISSKLL